MPALFRPPKVIAVDVDGTLHSGGTVKAAVIEWCRKKKAEGYQMILWSSRGEDHARNAAKSFGAEDIFDHILSKPGYILDDQGWGWIKYTSVVRSVNADLG